MATTPSDPTTVPGPQVGPAIELHKARRAAESFGSDAERYDRARPSYPDALIRRIVTESPGPDSPGSGPDILDVGTGTGIAARQLQALGCRVLGVEVDARMAELARRGGLEVEVATFENWDPAGRTFDAVVSAQAWHWVDPVTGPVSAAGALRPGGRLIPFWNVAQLPPELQESIAAVYRRVSPDSVTARSLKTPVMDAYAATCTTVADGIRASGCFTEPEQWRLDWERAYTRDEWLDQVATTTSHSQLPPPEQEASLAGIAAAIDAAIGTADGSADGTFTVSYATLAVAAART